MLRGSEKRNVIPPEASADIDCRMLLGDDPEEIVAWVRGVIADPRLEVSLINPPHKIPNAPPPDTPLYKALGEALRRRAPGAVVAPDILVQNQVGFPGRAYPFRTLTSATCASALRRTGISLTTGAASLP